MTQSVTFELNSQCPVEVVYGLSSATLKAIKSNNQDAEGYDWSIILDNSAEQREEFLSGVDIDDAELIVTDQAGATSKYRFLTEEQCEDEDYLDPIIQYEPSAFTDAGHDLKTLGLDWIIITRLDLKYRSWKYVARLEDIFDKRNVKVRIKKRDSEVPLASEIYHLWFSDFENSVVSVYYSGMKIPFVIDFSSYPPEFLCLKRTSKGWSRDKALELFFSGT